MGEAGEDDHQSMAQTLLDPLELLGQVVEIPAADMLEFTPFAEISDALLGLEIWSRAWKTFHRKTFQMKSPCGSRG